MTPDAYREAIKEIASWLEPIRSHETNSTPYKRIIEARRIADRALASTTAALPPPESGSSGLGSASALEVEADERDIEETRRDVALIRGALQVTYDEIALIVEPMPADVAEKYLASVRAPLEAFDRLASATKPEDS